MKAVWTNNGVDIPIEITGVLGEYNGKKYFSIKESFTGIPEDEITLDENYLKLVRIGAI